MHANSHSTFTTPVLFFIWPIFQQVAAVNNSIPAYPMLIENGGTTDLSQTAGGIGIMRNGVSMFRCVRWPSAGVFRAGFGPDRRSVMHTN